METTIQPIFQKIHEIRGQKVMLDSDLAELYDIEVKYLKRAVNNNLYRFPADFMFQLTEKEYNDSLRCRFSTLKKGRGQHIKYLPYAFSEQGVAMLSSVLNSRRAIEVNIAIMRAFVAMRNYALNYADLNNRLKEFMKTTDTNFSEVFNILEELMAKKNSTKIENQLALLCDKMRVKKSNKQKHQTYGNNHSTDFQENSRNQRAESYARF
jgi:hypothetical protein